MSKIGIEGIIKLVENKDRYCYFENILAYMRLKLKESKLFSFKIQRTISEKPKGEIKNYFWSDYFLIFVPEDLDKTLTELRKRKNMKNGERNFIKSHI